MASSLVLNRNRKVPAEDTAAFGAIAERFRRGGALERAVSLCREGLQKFPDHVSARVTLGWSLLDLGKYDEARLELEQVLRRAPDNLAAIRGLAELHDRFEHTLNLPMDGPGQWPPPPEATAHIADAPVAADQGAATLNANDPADVEFAPAELGIPIWSPAAAVAAPEPQAFVEAPSIDVEEPSIQLDAEPEAEPEIVVAAAAPPAPVAASAPPVMTAAASPAAAVGAGMSSVREIEMTPAVVEAVAFAGGDDNLVAAEAEIAALIAEAESLDAAADVAEPLAQSVDVSLDAGASLEVEDPALELSVAADASDDIDLPLVLDAVTPEFAVGEAVALDDSEAVLLADAGTESPAEPGLALVQAEASSFAGGEPVAAASIEHDEPAAFANIDHEEPVALANVAYEEPVAFANGTHDEPVAVAAVEDEPVDDGRPSFELTAWVPSEALAEDDEDSADADAVGVAMDESLAPVLPFHLAPVHPALPALERFLTQVHARRSQLMAQSVA